MSPRQPGPVNQSRAAGAPAPASAAATEPMYQAHGGSDWSEPSPLEQAVQVAENTTTDVALAAQYEGLTEDEILIAEIARIKATRQPAGSFTQKLFYPARRGYKRHWFSDSPGRVLQAGIAGWAHVTGQDGKPVARHVGTGRDNQGLAGYLMELPEAIWQEDMDLRHRQAREKVEALKASPFRAPAGTAQASDQGKMYSPTDVDPIQIVKSN